MNASILSFFKFTWTWGYIHSFSVFGLDFICFSKQLFVFYNLHSLVFLLPLCWSYPRVMNHSLYLFFIRAEDYTDWRWLVWFFLYIFVLYSLFPLLPPDTFLPFFAMINRCGSCNVRLRKIEDYQIGIKCMLCLKLFHKNAFL